MTRTFPWDDPGATGYGRRVDVETYKRLIGQSRANIAKRGCLLRSLPEYHRAFMEFMSRNDMAADLDLLDGGSEVWKATVGYERLERYVWFTVRPTTQLDGVEIFINAAAYWIGGPRDSYSTLPPRRRFILTSRCSADTFAETLELALADAKALTVQDLNPEPLPSAAPPTVGPEPGPRLDQ